MLEPKMPLPWWQREGLVYSAVSSIYDGQFHDPKDAASAVHAANVLPEVTAALREAVIDALRPFAWAAASEEG